MKSNIHKKMTFEDKFYRNYCCGKINHNSSWSKEKRLTRKSFRTKMKVLLQGELYDNRTMLNIPISDFFECATTKELIEIFGTADVNSIFSEYDNIEIIQKILDYENQF